MLDAKQLEAFYMVASSQSFEKAAQLLYLTPSAISQRIKALETSLSAVLFERGVPIELTDKGQQLYRYTQALSCMEQELLTQLKPSMVQKNHISMTIAVNADSFATWWRKVHPSLFHKFGIVVEMLVDDQEHTLTLFNKGRVVGCVSARELNKDGAISQLLGYMSYTCVASHDFVKTYFPNGLNIKTISDAPAILCSRKDSRHDEMLFQVFNVKQFEYSKIFMPSPESFLDALVQSCGYGMMPVMQIENELRTGKLIDLTPNHHYQMPLYWCFWHNQSNLYSRITNYIVEQAKQLLTRN
ncbi:MAG: putative HTH-type transcriptional regulator [Burkholderiaceae bacterium]|nr:putative HTH-type transcriptional regulator [Burkholderiaceae bacterium]